MIYTANSINIKSIDIDQKEGHADKLVCETVASLGAANAILRDISRQPAPNDRGGCLKTNVLVTWNDGTQQPFRVDIIPGSPDKGTNLTQVLFDWATRNQINSDGPHVKNFMDSGMRANVERRAERILVGELVIS